MSLSLRVEGPVLPFTVAKRAENTRPLTVVSGGLAVYRAYVLFSWLVFNKKIVRQYNLTILIGLIQSLFNASESFINAMQQSEEGVLGGLQRGEVQLEFAVMEVPFGADRIKAV